MNAQEFLTRLNIATTHRNLAWRRMARELATGNRRLAAEYRTLMLGWEARAKSYAAKAGTRLVQMPDHPEAITAAAFLNLLP